MLNGRVVLITGASRGIGAASAKLLGQHGAHVAVNYLNNADAAREVVQSIENEGGHAAAFQADARDREQVDAMVKEVTSSLGAIDVLVLNASIQFPVVPFIEYPWEAFEAKLVGELGAAFHCTRAVVPGMIERGGGSIIAVSSGLSRHPGPGFCAHSSAKSGLDGFAKSLALELGPHGIRVNVVAPGLTITDATAFLPEERKQAMARMTPLGRNAMPEDIAGVILAFAADATAFVSGAYVPVSGGTLMP